MTSKTKKTTAVMAAFAVITTASAGFISACAPKSENSGYTYNDYASSLATNWNPHTWEMDVDRAILDFVASPFVDISIDDSNESIYQWVYEMATEVNDVTASNLSDLTKYGSAFTGTPDSGYVYEIKLNPDACWQNGERLSVFYGAASSFGYAQLPREPVYIRRKRACGREGVLQFGRAYLQPRRSAVR